MGSTELEFTDTGGDKPALLFTHGILMNREVWKNQVDAFAEDYRVINIDLRGFGASPHDKDEVTYEDHATDLISLVHDLSLRDAILVGWSFGGAIGQVLAARDADVLARMILVSATPKLIQAPDFPDAIPVEAAQQLGEALAADFSTGCRAFAEMIVPESGKGEIIDFLHRISAASDPQYSLATFGHAGARDLRPLLGEIRTPTFVVWGSLDRVCPPGANRYLVENIPGAKGRELPGLGHAPMLTDPNAFNATLREFVA